MGFTRRPLGSWPGGSCRIPQSKAEHEPHLNYTITRNVHYQTEVITQ